MKIYAKKLNTEHLTKHFLNIGKPERERNKENLDNVFSTPSKNDHINLEKSYQTLRKSLLSVSSIISRGGKVLVLHKQGEKVEKALENIFTKEWPKGLISNFKSIGKKYGVFPNYAVIATGSSEEQLNIENETTRYKVGSVFLTNTNSRRSGVYSLLSNTESDASINLVVNLYKRAVTLGLLKEVAKIDPRKNKTVNYRKKFPRLGSNQRPRT